MNEMGGTRVKSMDIVLVKFLRIIDLISRWDLSAHHCLMRQPKFLNQSSSKAE